MIQTYDVLIVGAGVIGCSVARELSRYRLSVCVAEKGPDICMETSSGIRPCFMRDIITGPVQRWRGSAWRETEALTKLPRSWTYRISGPESLCGLYRGRYEALRKLKEQGEKNGIRGMEIVGRTLWIKRLLS